MGKVLVAKFNQLLVSYSLVSHNKGDWDLSPLRISLCHHR